MTTARLPSPLGTAWPSSNARRGCPTRISCRRSSGLIGGAHREWAQASGYSNPGIQAWLARETFTCPDDGAVDDAAIVLYALAERLCDPQFLEHHLDAMSHFCGTHPDWIVTIISTIAEGSDLAVCEGKAEYRELDPEILRILWKHAYELGLSETDVAAYTISTPAAGE